MRFAIGDRATLVRDFDIAELAIGTAKDWLRQNRPESIPTVTARTRSS